MTKSRLEAFSDGVLAIAITIMVLELKIPHGNDLASIKPLAPMLLAYLLSFVFIGIYWNNHHHMLQAADKVDGKVLWANLHLLFWLSLIPFGTGWLAESHFSTFPVIFYGALLLGAAIAYYLLARSLARLHGPDSAIALALGNDNKGKASVGVYILALLLALISAWLAYALFILVAVMWLVPDQRIERILHSEKKRRIHR